MSSFPEIFRVRQAFPRPVVQDIATEVDQQLQRLDLGNRIQPGDSVAITAGSRGIANIAEILRATVAHLKKLGAVPFLVPAMGSHGGGTAEGQLEVLHSYGITESFCGCPIRASMETVIVCQAAEGFPVHFDQFAWNANHVLVCGRVKPHTGFVGDIESGLMKMMLIGLGKHNGAKIYHRAIQNYSFGQILRSVAREVLDKCRIVAGLALVENGYKDTACIEAVAPQDFEVRERELLKLARQWMPKLPFDDADILLIDEIGKDISGTGLDSNVVGRKYLDEAATEQDEVRIKHIVVRGLTQKTQGNATGIGKATFCLSRALRDMDVKKTRINCLTGGHARAAMLPLDYESDTEILDTALSVIGLVEPQDARLMWIPNTLDVAEVECSRAYLELARQRADLEVVSSLRPMPMNAQGMLPQVKSLAHEIPQTCDRR